MIKKDFFNGNSVKVARGLIGCFLCRKIDNKVYKYKIVETEAYEGFKDKASHASKGKTERNKIMFDESGRWYVYFTYGMHYMLNIVCGKKNYPAAVLIRGVEDIIGPARLTKYLKIDKKFNDLPASKKTGLWIESIDTKFHGRGKVHNQKLKILSTHRIGVAFSGPIWSQKKYRFILSGFETKKFK